MHAGESVGTFVAELRRLSEHCMHATMARRWMPCMLRYVRPILEYAAVVWAPHTKCDIDRLEAVQRRAIQIPHKFSEEDAHDSIMIMMNLLMK